MNHNKLALLTFGMLFSVACADRAVLHFDDTQADVIAKNMTRSGCYGCKQPPTGKAGPTTCCDVVTSVFFTAINPGDVNNNANPSLVIANPGIYFLSGSVIASPAANGTTFIKIDSDNVTLNLNSQVVGQSSTNLNTNNVGIEVAAGRSNIRISNGNISNVKGIGIKIGAGASGISLESINIEGTTGYGISVEGTSLQRVSGLNIHSVAVSDSSGTDSLATAGAVGLKTAYTDNIMIESSEFNNNQASAGKNGIGLYLDNTCSAQIVMSNAGTNAGDNGYGFRFSNSSSVKVIGSSAVCNVGNNGNGVGFFSENSDSTVIMTSTGQGNTSYAGGYAAGFSFVNSNCGILDSDIAVSNTSIAGAAYGFQFDSSDGANIVCGKALCNTSSTSTAYGFAFVDSNNNSVSDSLAQNNKSNGTGVTGSAYGYYTSNSTGNRFDSDQAIGNTGGSGTTAIGAGFAFVNGSGCTSVVCSEAIANGAPAGEGYGIKQGSAGDLVTGGATNMTIDSNKLNCNIGGTKSYGFKDFSSCLCSYLSRNTAFGQGRVFPLAAGNIITDDGNNNYQFTLCNPSANPANMIVETDIATLTTLDTAGPGHNLSFYC